jgi:UDP-2-acetamido-3-amino-2,3-dideoxy-glucuronate N-acetyltransferase
MVFTNVSNPRAEIDRKHEFKKTLVRRGATIGANVTVLCGVTIGRYAFVGAGAVVTRDVRDYSLVVGNPAREAGYVCRCGSKLPSGKWKTATCAACRRGYRMKDGTVTPVGKASSRRR